MPTKKKSEKRKKVSFWTTIKVPKRVKVEFYARKKSSTSKKKLKK
jgi:hypothetical protein